jgi:prophage antirepressor-like protein
MTARHKPRLDEDERGISTIETPSGDQQMVIVSESGLYALVMTSRKRQAKRFRKWVTSEVIDSA